MARSGPVDDDRYMYVLAASEEQAELLRALMASGMDDLWFAGSLVLDYGSRKAADNALSFAHRDGFLLTGEDWEKARNFSVHKVVRPGCENYRTPESEITEAERATAVRLGLDPQQVHEIMDAFGEEAGRIARAARDEGAARRDELLRLRAQQKEGN